MTDRYIAVDAKNDPGGYLGLYSILEDSLPSFIAAGNEKCVKRNFKKSGFALSNYKFIRYNVKKATTILMFDVDEIDMDLQSFSKYLYKVSGIIATFITKTSNGIQFGIKLKKPLFTYTSKKSNNFSFDYLLAKEFKKKLTSLIGGDNFGSNRMLGIWRNPLLHDTLFSSKEYHLEYLFDLLDIKESKKRSISTGRQLPSPEEAYAFKQRDFNESNYVSSSHNTSTVNIKFKLGENTNTAQTIKKGFIIGNRNNYLFSLGFKIVFEDRSKVSVIKDELIKINVLYDNSLPVKDVEVIADNVVKYSKKMYLPTINGKDRAVRGRLSDEMWEQGIHGIKNRRSYSGKTISKERREKAITTLRNAISSFYSRFMKIPTKSELADLTGFSIRHIYRLTTNICINLLDMFKDMFLKPCILKNNTVIRAVVNSFDVISAFFTEPRSL